MAGERSTSENSPAVTKRSRTERTERLLIAQLEDLARALERSGLPNETITHLLESASVATMNAVALNLLSAEVAEEIWHEVEERHPDVAPLPRAA